MLIHKITCLVLTNACYLTFFCSRFEGIELARERDKRAMEAWGMHPYMDVVDNRAGFETKVIKVIETKRSNMTSSKNPTEGQTSYCTSNYIN